jgi:rhomboid protease GluP
MAADLADPFELDVRATASAARVGDWALVLNSAGIAHRIDERDTGLILVVAASDGAAALAALDAFDSESVRVEQPPAPDLGPSPLGLACAVVLIAMFVGASARDAASASLWLQAGSASADLIVRGAWWRAATALMLHADLAHLTGNVVASLLFVSAVGRWLGVGLGGVLILAAAVAANLLTALVYRTGHDSIGASTATFAALGMLAGLQVVRRLRHEARRRHPWLPLVAGVGLVLLLGTSERADVLAHVFGLASGVVAGGSVALSGLQPPGRFAQAAMASVTVGLLVGAWVLAFRAG